MHDVCCRQWLHKRLIKQQFILSHFQIYQTALTLGLHSSALTTGVYNIGNVCNIQSWFQIPGTVNPAMQARCDMDSEDGGWMIILRRKADVSEQVNFNSSWREYENGFGGLKTDSEFWYGLRNIHCLTTRDNVDLRIELKQNDGSGLTWNYGYFKVDGPETNYILHIGEGEGSDGGNDAMGYHNGHPFTTYDRVNDARSSNCALRDSGGWWYNNCFHAHLTGPHIRQTNYDQLLWSHDGGNTFTYYPNAEMKVRPKKCNTKKKTCE